eukprot:8104882-Ditylum_brightwellii.AAC.1
MDDEVMKFKQETRSRIIDTAFKELGDAVQHCSVPDEEILWGQTILTKSFCFRGFPGSGKTLLLLYNALYAISTGLTVITTAMMAKHAI